MNDTHKRYPWYILAALLIVFVLVYVFSRPAVAPSPQQDPNTNGQPPGEPQGMREVGVYFTNSVYDPEFTCTKVFPVKRYIPAASEPIRAAIEELLKGPTAAESLQEYQTSLNPGTELQSVTETPTTVQLDFNAQLDYQVGGSCRVAAIWSQIAETAKQFVPGKEIILSIDGRTDDILQP